MKKLLTALAIITTFSSMAQDKQQGKVLYSIQLNLHGMMNTEQAVEVKDAIPEFTTINTQLLFNGKYALVKEADQPETDDELCLDVSGLTEPTYINAETKKAMQVKERNNVRYLVEINKVSADARMEETGETKKILGYTCKKLIIKDSVDQTICWYTDEIPAIGSALGLMTNKGVVMELEGKMLSFKATAVLFGATELNSVMPPKDIAVISEAAFMQQ